MKQSFKEAVVLIAFIYFLFVNNYWAYVGGKINVGAALLNEIRRILIL